MGEGAQGQFADWLDKCAVEPHKSCDYYILMTETQCVVHTPFQKAHVHFYDFIESFPGLPEGESFDSHSKRLQTEVKYQFMTLKEDQAIRCKPFA